MQPVWRRDGKELFYLTLEGVLTAVTVDTTRRFRVGPATPLFKTSLTTSPQVEEYAVDSSGRFLLSVPAGDGASPFVVITDWLSQVGR